MITEIASRWIDGSTWLSAAITRRKNKRMILHRRTVWVSDRMSLPARRGMGRFWYHVGYSYWNLRSFIIVSTGSLEWPMISGYACRICTTWAWKRGLATHPQGVTDRPRVGDAKSRLIWCRERICFLLFRFTDRPRADVAGVVLIEWLNDRIFLSYSAPNTVTFGCVIRFHYFVKCDFITQVRSTLLQFS